MVLVVDDVGGAVGLEDLAREGVGALRSGASVVEGRVAPLVRGVHVTAFRQEDFWKKARHIALHSRADMREIYKKIALLSVVVGDFQMQLLLYDDMLLIRIVNHETLLIN